MNIKIDHINMSVRSLEDSINFYSKIFAFHPYEEGISKGIRWKILRNDETFLCLYQNTELFSDTQNNPRPALIDHFGFRINNKESWQQLIEEHQIPLNYGGPVDYPHSTSWYINDPSGHEIEVSYWPNATVKTTAP